MFQIDVMSRIPIYEQIMAQVEKFILAGVLSEGDMIPSICSLSMELSVNPNMIQMAFAELDRRCFVNSIPGKGCFVSDKSRRGKQFFQKERLKKLSGRIRELALTGISKEEVISCVDKVFDEEAKK